MDLAVAVDPAALQPRLLGQFTKASSPHGHGLHLRLEPRVKPARMNAEDPAHRSCPKPCPVISDECMLHRDSLAKYAAAFFRMSCSSVTRFSSAFTAFSSSTSLDRLVPLSP